VVLKKEERREHSRVESDLTARVQRGLRSFDGLIRNVSESGVFLCSSQRLLPGECVRIAVEPRHCGPMLFDAEVIWSSILGQEEPGGLYGIGFRFLDVCLTHT
jgi:hypothetical protein